VIAAYLVGAALWALMLGYFVWAEIDERRARVRLPRRVQSGAVRAAAGRGAARPRRKARLA
jgi:hypothetical protein